MRQQKADPIPRHHDRDRNNSGKPRTGTAIATAAYTRYGYYGRPTPTLRDYRVLPIYDTATAAVLRQYTPARLPPRYYPTVRHL